MFKCPGVAIKAALVLALVALLVPGTAGADNYPERPVRIIVPIGPGGSYDYVGRLLASRLTELMGQSFFVENRTGAGTLVGTQSAAAAAPDGYTLLIGGLSNMAFNFALYQKVGYELNDFVPIALVYTFPYVMVARSDLPQRNLAEIIDYGRQSPGKLTIAHAGTGSGQQIVSAAFMRRTGTTMIEVPYRTIRGAYVDMLAGRVDLMFNSAAAALPYIAAKKVRGIALLAPERYRTVPDLPTIAEAGLGGLGIEFLDRPVRAGRHAARRARQAAQHHPGRRRRPQGKFREERRRADADAGRRHRQVHQVRIRAVDAGDPRCRHPPRLNAPRRSARGVRP